MQAKPDYLAYAVSGLFSGVVTNRRQPRGEKIAGRGEEGERVSVERVAVGQLT